jgi:hypothetical protein
LFLTTIMSGLFAKTSRLYPLILYPFYPIIIIIIIIIMRYLHFVYKINTQMAYRVWSSFRISARPNSGATARILTKFSFGVMPSVVCLKS